MDISLQKEFNFTGLIKFSFPTIAMMVFMSTYTTVDGAFISKYVSTTALSGLNIAYPPYNIIIAIGVMLGAGGSALIAKQMGEDDFQGAKENFSLIIYAAIAIGVVIAILGNIFMVPMLRLLGATDILMPYSFDYANTLFYFAIPTVLQMIFQYLFITAGKPHLGLFLTLLGGGLNIVLDYIFIVPLDMGIKGAALATGFGTMIPALVGLIYFSVNRTGSLYFVKTRPRIKVFLVSCANGSSEMVTEFSNAIITFLYNIVMLKYLGENGVAAITILLYLDFVLKAVTLGFSMGVAPVISYNYGSQNKPQIKRIFKYCVYFVMGISVSVYVVSVVLAPQLTGIFAHEGTEVHDLAMSGFMLYSISFLFSGLNIFASALFTAFSNGKISALISFLRTFGFLATSLLFLPPLIGIKGAWMAVAIAEILSLVMSFFLIAKYRHVYKYL